MACIFDSALYQAARESRLRNLWRHLDRRSLAGERILEVGCGTGELGQSFVEAGCQVVSVDARAEYVEELGRRFPGREAHVVNLEKRDPTPLGTFGAVLCFGVLYHLADPKKFLAVCCTIAPTLFLETVVSDSAAPVCPRVVEEGPDQACSGRGCRPSPAWLLQVLDGLGFRARDISSAEANWGGAWPAVYDWLPRDDGQWMRDGALLRKMLICDRAG